MKGSLTAFTEGLENLRNYLKSLELQWRLLATRITGDDPTETERLVGELQQHTLQFVAQKRRFDYNSVIISLYGLFEQFVEALIRAYAAYIVTVVPRYSELPEAITANHVSLTIELIKAISSDERRFNQLKITTDQLIANLHICVVDAPNYQLNGDAFAFHNANFRTIPIVRAFARLGIPDLCERAIKSAKATGSVLADDGLFLIDDLADRRNDVAHGVTADLLSIDLMLDRISFMSALGESIFEVVYGESLAYSVNHAGIPLGRPINVYNKSIVCVTVHNTNICVGDLLVAKTGNNVRPYIGGEIKELQENNVSYQRLDAAPSRDVGMAVSYVAKINHTFYLIPRKSAEAVSRRNPQIPLSFNVSLEDVIEGDVDETEQATVTTTD